MNRIRKKKGNKIKKLELHKRVKIKSLEKKPQKGGTPAIENNAKIKTFVKKLFEPKSLKEYKVL
jgi:hypothetical protein